MSRHLRAINAISKLRTKAAEKAGKRSDGSTYMEGFDDGEINGLTLAIREILKLNEAEEGNPCAPEALDALKFYADRDTWRGEYPNAPIHKDVDGDMQAVPGLRARTALAKARAETEVE